MTEGFSYAARREADQRRARSLPVAGGSLETATDTGTGSSIVGSSEPHMSKSNGPGQPMSGYERMARAAAGETGLY